MRKIGSKHDEEKKHKRNQLIIGVILILVMFGSVFGIIVGSFGKEDNTKTEYNGFEFTKQNERWLLNIGDFQFVFRYNPYEVEEIEANSSLKYLNNYYNKPLYISSENNEASSEIYMNLESIIERVQSACLEGEKCEGGLPVKTCASNFIIIREGNLDNITQKENCVFIYGSQENLTKVSDEFLFQIMGVRQ